MLETKGRSSNAIWVVGEYATYNDLKHKSVFAGQSGQILFDQLESAGFNIEDIHFRYVTSERPPRGELSSWICTKTQVDKKGFLPYGNKLEYGIDYGLAESIASLLSDIDQHKPKIVFACGELALIALTQKEGITKWRGSMIEQDGALEGTLVVPTFSTVKVMQNWDWSFFQKQDFVRGRKFLAGDLPPKYEERFEIRPSFSHVHDRLQLLIQEANQRPDNLPLELGVDIEGWGTITCIGLAWTPSDAICIPFVSATQLCGQSGSYWRHDQELTIIRLLARLLTHPNVRSQGHNFNYDRTHICRLWGFNPRLGMDTMQAWHILFPLLPKALFQVCSFLLPWYVYWKDEGAGHNPTSCADEDVYWRYNCKDCCRTLELVPLLNELIDDEGMRDQYTEQRNLNLPVMRMMLRGVKQNVALRNSYALSLIGELAKYEGWFEYITPALLGDNVLVKTKKAKPWYRSPTQQAKLFYDVLGLPVQKNKKTKKPTTEDAALQCLSEKEPLLRPVFKKLIEYRSLGVFLSTFVLAPLDHDKRFRCTYGIGMTETFRFTSSKDAFGFGGNLQNIPKGNVLDEED